jgi:hypothetical protein
MVSHRLRLASVCLVGLVGLGCPSDDGGQDTDMSTTTTDASSSTSDSTGSSSSSTSDSTSTTTDEPTSVTGDITSDGSTGSCPVGTEGCPCDEGSCDGALQCINDVCEAVAGSCETEIDAEPNDEEGTAVDLDEVACDMTMGADGSIASGTSDWFTFHGNDAMNCSMSSIAVVDNDDMQDLTVCMFFDCDMGEPQVVCPGDATEETTPGGIDGCCGTNSVAFTTQSCLGAATNDSGTVLLRVDGSAEQSCVDYQLGYRFF